ncbi:MAG: M14 family zinc carboxypeptidase [Patescibacteria group bacterium]
MKKTIIALVVIIILGVCIYFVTKNASPKDVVVEDTTATSEQDAKAAADAKAKADADAKNAPVVSIGKSVEGRDITAYHFGTGTTEVLFVGGIHGGYAWNTSLLAYQLMDYLKANPAIVPANVKVTVIPVLNPDGLNVVTGVDGRFTASQVSKVASVLVSGRFNANDVDINRNFDCDWQASGKWQDKTVSGGANAFSEPESVAVQNYVIGNKPAAVIGWYASAGGVYASSCHNGVLKQTTDITKVFSDASGYPAHEDYNYYELTGDMMNWLAKNNIPAVSVLLKNHTDTDWSQNKAGIEAVLKYFTK